MTPVVHPDPGSGSYFFTHPGFPDPGVKKAPNPESATLFFVKLTCVLICLIYFVGRTIVLYNPDAKGLTQAARVEQLRERVYATLEEYTRYPRKSLKGTVIRYSVGGF
jgi:hypothetical protein